VSQGMSDRDERAVWMLCDGVARFEDEFVFAVVHRLPPIAREILQHEIANEEDHFVNRDFLPVARRAASICRRIIIEGAYVGSASDLFRNFVRATAAEISRSFGDTSHIVCLRKGSEVAADTNYFSRADETAR